MNLYTLIRIAVLLLLAVLGAGGAHADDPYLEDIASAAVRIHQGNYDRAVEDINNAFTKRSGDPLAHVALGTVFIHTRQLTAAYKEFTTARALDEQNTLAAYGLALYYLSAGKREFAREWFYRASANGTCDVTPALAYLSALSADYPKEMPAGDDPVLAQIMAYGRFKKQDYRQARDILTTLTKDIHGFREEPGAVVTLDPAKPLAFTGKGLSKPYKSPSEAEPGLKKVSGTVTLKAGLTRTQGITYVLFSVDDTLIGMVNHSPYECAWVTTRSSNAPHTIKIQGYGENGIVITERTMRVIVANRGESTEKPAAGEGADLADKKLWECLKLKPSWRLAFYTLAKCAEAQKDAPAALTALERVVAMDPDYRDARTLLIRRYSPLDNYREVWRGREDGKYIAITFDDGPNVRTNDLLDVLKEKGVKATFFIVGSMAEARPEMVRRMSEEGHQVENHTYSHRNLEYLPQVEIERELIRTKSLIRSITGKDSRLFRLPGGHHNGNLSSAAGKYGFRLVFWTVNCSKYEGKTPDQIVKPVTSDASSGGVILMHNVEDVTLLALPKVIDNLRAAGYKLVTMNELLK